MLRAALETARSCKDERDTSNTTLRPALRPFFQSLHSTSRIALRKRLATRPMEEDRAPRRHNFCIGCGNRERPARVEAGEAPKAERSPELTLSIQHPQHCERGRSQHTRSTTNCRGLTQRLEHLSREVTKSASCGGDLHASRLRLDLHARQSISTETNLFSPRPPLETPNSPGQLIKRPFSSRAAVDSDTTPPRKEFLVRFTGISFSSFFSFLLCQRFSRSYARSAACRSRRFVYIT